MLEDSPNNTHQIMYPDGFRCELCGGDNFHLLHEWGVGNRWNPATVPIAVWQCECTLVFLHPVPTPDQLPDGADWWSPKRKFVPRNRRWKRFRYRIQKSLFGTPLRRLVGQTRKVIASGRLLDVGCGRGELLELAAPSFECVGLEPSPSAATQARAKGIPIIEASFESADIQPQSFDLVTMDAVIEHVRHPLEVLKKTNRILRKDGIVALWNVLPDVSAYCRWDRQQSENSHGWPGSLGPTGSDLPANGRVPRGTTTRRHGNR